MLAFGGCKLKNFRNWRPIENFVIRHSHDFQAISGPTSQFQSSLLYFSSGFGGLINFFFPPFYLSFGQIQTMKDHQVVGKK